MHASIALWVMMVGGCLPPESEITTVPLKDDLFGLTSIQDLELKERSARVRLPQVPTISNTQQPADDYQPHKRYQPPYSPMDPRAAQRPMPMMPTPPTDAGPSVGGGYQPERYGQTRGYQPGGGYQAGGGYQPGGGYSSGTPKNDPYANNLMGGATPAGYAPPMPQRAPIVPTANNYITGANPLLGMLNQAGIGASSNPYANASAGGGSKPYNDYVAPNGYSPWNALYTTPTNNGTVNSYTSAVQPAMQQQNFNSHMSEQINGVLTSPRYNNSGTPGMEVPMGSNGMANPQIFQNYKNYYPTY